MGELTGFDWAVIVIWVTALVLTLSLAWYFLGEKR